MTWQLDILTTALSGCGHRVALGKVSGTPALYCLFAEAAAADLSDADLGALVREIARLLPPAEFVLRQDRLTPDDVQWLVLQGANHRARARRANARGPVYIHEAAP